MVWNADMKAIEKPLQNIFNAVRGEQVIENLLKEARDFWFAAEFDTYRYNTKVKILRGWNEIFDRCDEDL